LKYSGSISTFPKLYQQEAVQPVRLPQPLILAQSVVLRQLKPRYISLFLADAQATAQRASSATRASSERTPPENTFS